MANVINLTPHDVKLVIGEKTIVIPKDGRTIRASEHVSEHGSIVIDGISVPIKGKLLGAPVLVNEDGVEVGDLDTIRSLDGDFIVSLASAKAIKSVDADLATRAYVPNDVIREDGVIKGCASLVCAAFLE